MTTLSLADALTLPAVMALADEKTIARGHACFNDGAVSRLDMDDDHVRATVRGTYSYTVEFGVGRAGELEYACNCPVGSRNEFCKHAVAVAFSWLENAGEEVFAPRETEPKRARKPRKTNADLIGDYLATLDADALRGYLLDAARRDRALGDQLLLAARGASGDLAGLKAAVRRVARATRHLDWREATGYADGLSALAGDLRKQLDGASASRVVELAELAFELALESLERVDDSNGGVMPAIRDLAALHLDACLRTLPEPVRLAERLFNLQMQDEWSNFDRVLPDYATVLGDDGLRRYRELVDARWAAQPVLRADAGRYASFNRERLQIEAAKLALARFDGDVDASIEALAKDLSSRYRFLLIAQACAKHGRDEDAIAWAERGMDDAIKQPPDTRLHDFCIGLHLRKRDFAAADAVAWRRFVCVPSAEAFQALMQVATATGGTDAMRARALGHLRDAVASAEAATRKAGKAAKAGAVRPVATRTELVKALLIDDDADAAWQAFNAGPVATDAWPAMATARARSHPHDAIALYHRLLPMAIERGRSGARYEAAFDIVDAIARLRHRHGEQAEFAAELGAIRSAHSAKRSFLKLLDRLNQAN